MSAPNATDLLARRLEYFKSFDLPGWAGRVVDRLMHAAYCN